MNDKEYTYDIDKYTIGVDTNGEDGIGMTVSKVENGEIYFLGNCYGENARCIDLLIKENQELKKKLNKANDELYTLKNKYNIRLLNQISENIEPDCEDYYLAEIETKANKYDLIQTQQKEFINYLEDLIKHKRLNATCMFEYNATVLPLKEILQKHKEIIGDDK